VNEPPNLRCPSCNSPWTPPLWSRVVSGKLQSQRECQDCGKKFYTREILSEAEMRKREEDSRRQRGAYSLSQRNFTT